MNTTKFCDTTKLTIEPPQNRFKPDQQKLKFRAHHDVPDGEVAAEAAADVVGEEPVPESVGHDVVDLLGALEAHPGDEIVEAAVAHEGRVEEVVRQVERILSQFPVRQLHPGRHQAVSEPGKSSGLRKTPRL